MTDRRIAAQSKGHAYVTKLKLGSWVAVQNRGEAGSDPYLVGKVVGKDGKALTDKVTARSEQVGETMFSRNDHMVAVRWYHRDDADSERLTFIEDDYAADVTDFETSASDPRGNGAWDVFNSTELRSIHLNFTEVPGSSRPVRRSSRTAAGRAPPKDTRFSLNPEDEQRIVEACW